jgi:hypothetical protein
MRTGALSGDESPGVICHRRRVRIPIRQVELPFGLQLLSTDLNEGRDACRIDPEAVCDEVIVGTHVAQTEPDPIGPREVIKVGTVHLSRMPRAQRRNLSIGY